MPFEIIRELMVMFNVAPVIRQALIAAALDNDLPRRVP